MALLIVLWLSVLLTVLASGLAFDTRSEVLAARNSIAQAKARLVADGAFHRAVFEMSKPAATADRWQANGEVHALAEAGMTVAVGVTDESGRIDVNTTSEALLRGLLTRIGGLDDERAASLLAAIQDWRDADELPRPNGAEEPQYRATGRSYKPGNQPFESVEELRRVLGVTEDLYARIAGALTVHSRLPGINSAVASREVLLALPAATEESVDAFLAQRGEAIAGRQPVPLFPPAAAFNAAPVQVWRVRSEAATGDGARFVREAVVRATTDPGRPATILLWKEGA